MMGCQVIPKYDEPCGICRKIMPDDENTSFYGGYGYRGFYICEQCTIDFKKWVEDERDRTYAEIGYYRPGKKPK